MDLKFEYICLDSVGQGTRKISIAIVISKFYCKIWDYQKDIHNKFSTKKALYNMFSRKSRKWINQC